MLIGAFSSYLLILDVGSAWLARALRWGFLNLITFAGTVILFAGWAEAFYQPADVWMFAADGSLPDRVCGIVSRSGLG